MKTRITIILFISIQLSINIFAQNRPLDGFLVFKWGDSKKEILNGMKKLGTATFDKEATSEISEYLFYVGGMFAMQKAKTWSFSFYKNQFYSVTVYFDVGEKSTLNIFEGLSNTIIEKYGKPLTQFETDNGLRLVWLFYSKGKNRSSSIVFDVDMKNFQVYLTYMNMELFQKVSEQIKNKSKNQL